jgi:hypothetical protein
MTQGVVYELEVVQVYEQQGDDALLASGARYGAREVLVEGGLVVQTGEVVVGGLVLEPPF